MLFKADFHIHSCLSPCGDLEMSPSDIIKEAKRKGLNLIAISDHNSAMNCPALYDLSLDDPEINCFYGIEVSSEEEVHILTLFDTPEQAGELSDLIYKSLPNVYYDPEKFGDQVYVDRDNNIIGEIDRYLGSPSGYNVSRIVDIVHSLGGIVIPAHVDRQVFSLSSQLGFIPEENFDALELSRHYLMRGDAGMIINLENYPHVTNSDAHYLGDIGVVYNVFECEEISVKSFLDILCKYRSEMVINSIS